MRNLSIYYDDQADAWFAMLADSFEQVAKYQFAGETAAAQEASIKAMAQKMANKDVTGWNDLFTDVDTNEVAEVGMQLMDAEELLYSGAAAPVWTAPAEEPTMTILLDLEKAGEEFLEVLAEVGA